MGIGKTILIIDDSATLRQVVKMTLKAEGYEILEANNGEEAIHMLNMYPKIHLIISDVNMPKMDGIAFLKHIKDCPQYTFTPIIMLTTESSDDKKRQGQQAGAYAWVVKPFRPASLLNAISKIIRST